MTTRTSIPSARSDFGSAPATSANPPVLAKGAHSEATNRTLRMAAGPTSESAGVDMVVDLRENVVPRLDVGEPALVHLGAAQIVIELVELHDVLVDALGGVRHRRPRPHDERPVARLRQHQLARRLIERPGGERIGAGLATGQLDHPL